MTPVGSLYLRGARFRLVVSFAAAAFAAGFAVVDHGAADTPGSSGIRPHAESTVAALFTLPVPSAAPAPASPSSRELSAEEIYDRFTESGYTLDAVRVGGVAVPRTFLARLPSDLPEVDSIDQRKQVFVKMLLPLVLLENERLLMDRERLVVLRDQAQAGAPPSAQDRRWIEALTERYGLNDGKTRNLLDELVRRVDMVPPSLAIGQAALETGWGTSRPAQRGRAMFGQMVFYGEGENTVSAVRRFEHLAHAVEAYALNLNTHKAYNRFRTKRAEMRAKGTALDGYDLVLTLSSYSERKMDYVRDVRSIIRANKLRPLDAAQLGG
jgi:Bax protein